MHGDFDTATFELTFMKKPEAGSKIGDDRGGLVQRRRKFMSCPGIIVVFQESRQPILIRHISPEVSVDRRWHPGTANDRKDSYHSNSRSPAA